MAHSTADTTSERSSHKYTAKKATYQEAVVFIQGIRDRWLDWNIQTAELLEAKVEGDEWICSRDITVAFLTELEQRLAEVYAIQHSKKKDPRSKILHNLIVERDRALASLRSSKVHLESIRRVRSSIEPHRAQDDSLHDTLSEAASALSSSRQEDEGSEGVSKAMIAVISQQCTEIERLKKRNKELEAALSRERNERERVMQREDLPQHPDTTHKRSRINQRVLTEKEYHQDASYWKGEYINRLTRDRNIPTRSLLPACPEEERFISEAFREVCQPRENLSVDNAADLITMREEYFNQRRRDT